MDDFACHVKVMHTDGDYRFNQEFEVSEYCLAFLWFKQLASFQCYYSVLMTALERAKRSKTYAYLWCLLLIGFFIRVVSILERRPPKRGVCLREVSALERCLP